MGDMAKLTWVIQYYLVQSPDNPDKIPSDHEQPAMKKMKVVERSPSPVSSTALLPPLAVTSTNELDSVISHDPNNIERSDPIDRIDSVGLSSFTTQDEEMLNSLLEATPLDDATAVSL